MTTPHIRELVIEYHKLFNANVVNEKGMKPHTSGEWVEQALTKAHQAGRDEAVGIIEKQTRYNMESDGACGDPECCGYPDYDMWESDDGEYLKRDDTIKALQDNK